MLVIDNFFPEELINFVIAEANRQEWVFNRTDSNEDQYWTRYIFGSDYSALPTHQTVIQEFVSENVKQCWEFFKIKSDCGLEDSNLDSAYFNGLTYGVEAHSHVDSLVDNSTTVIIYVCESWNSHWGGETVFFNGEYSKNPADNIFYSHDIVKSVLPKYNRILLFDGKIVHAVRPLSKSFKGLRKTLMFKIRRKNIEEFRKLCN